MNINILKKYPLLVVILLTLVCNGVLAYHSSSYLPFPGDGGYAYRYTDNGRRHEVSYYEENGLLVWELKRGGRLPFSNLYFDLQHTEQDEMTVRVCYQMTSDVERQCVLVTWDDVRYMPWDK